MIPIDPNIPELELRIYAKDQPEYVPLPARVDDSGTVVTCWKLSWKERWRMFFEGKLHITVLTFNRPLQPICTSPLRPVIENGRVV